MSIPFIDLKAQYALVEDEVRKGIDAVLEHGAYIMGPEIVEIENRLSSYSAVRHGVACASGTGRPAHGPDGPGGRSRRRRVHLPVHLHGHGRGHRPARGHPGVRGRGPGHLQHRPGRPAAHDRRDQGHPVGPDPQGRHCGGHLRPARRLRPHRASGPQQRPVPDRGCGPVLRGQLQGQAGLLPGRHGLHLVLPGQAAGLLRRRRHGLRPQRRAAQAAPVHPRPRHGRGPLPERAHRHQRQARFHPGRRAARQVRDFPG